MVVFSSWSIARSWSCAWDDERGGKQEVLGAVRHCHELLHGTFKRAYAHLGRASAWGKGSPRHRCSRRSSCCYSWCWRCCCDARGSGHPRQLALGCSSPNFAPNHCSCHHPSGEERDGCRSMLLTQPRLGNAMRHASQVALVRKAHGLQISFAAACGGLNCSFAAAVAAQGDGLWLGLHPCTLSGAPTSVSLLSQLACTGSGKQSLSELLGVYGRRQRWQSTLIQALSVYARWRAHISHALDLTVRRRGHLGTGVC
jgi:hypothetical protein